MKVARLPNGTELTFPDETSNEVVKATVKRVLGVEDGHKIEDVLDQLSSALTERDRVDFYGPAITEQVKTTKESAKKLVEVVSKLKFEQKDTIPALKEQTKVLEKRNGFFQKQVDHIRDFIDVFKKTKAVDQELSRKSIADMVDVIKNVSVHLELLALRMDKNTEAIVTSNAENTKAVHELVKAYRSPKEIIRDKDGKPKSIK